MQNPSLTCAPETRTVYVHSERGGAQVAARARTTQRTDRPTERLALSAPPLALPTPGRARRLARRTFGWLRHVEVGHRLRDELIAFGVFTVAVLTALPLMGLGGDSVLALLSAGLAYLLGRAALVVP